MVLAFFFNGPSALVTTAIAILHQANLAARVLSGMFLLPMPLKLLFDAVMSREGHDELVLRSRLRRGAELSTVAIGKQTTKSIVKNTVAPKWLFRTFLRISLNFVPFVGPLIIVMMDGPSHGRKAHSRYFELKRFDGKETDHYVRSRRGQYWGFGMIAGALETVPLIGFIFTFTNTVGAAIWASQIETRLINKSRLMLEQSRRNHQPSLMGEQQQNITKKKQ